LAFPGYLHCGASNMHKIWTWWVLPPISLLVTCNWSLPPPQACWLHWILNRSLSEVNAITVDHILDGSGLSSCDLPTSVDLQALPDNDKKKAIILTDIIYYPAFFHQFSIYVYRYLFKLCTWCSSHWGSQEDHQWKNVMPYLLFLQPTRAVHLCFVTMYSVGSALKCNLRNNKIVNCIIQFHEMFGYSRVCV
jgi:hypothetical protein